MMKNVCFMEPQEKKWWKERIEKIKRIIIAIIPQTNTHTHKNTIIIIITRKENGNHIFMCCPRTNWGFVFFLQHYHHRHTHIFGYYISVFWCLVAWYPHTEINVVIGQKNYCRKKQWALGYHYITINIELE